VAIYLTTEAGDRLITEGGAYLTGERYYEPYEGYNLFEMKPNWAESPTERLSRNMTILENVTGRPLVRSHTAGPVGSMDVMFTLDGRDQMKEFRSWLRAMKGRQVPVWLPTWNMDLKPTANLSGTSITVESIGYEDNLYPHNARKHLALIDHEGTIYPRGVTGAADNGTTETLTITPTLGTTLTKEHTIISFLVLARLMRDEVRIVYITKDLAEVQMGFVEVPREVPAP
jgi:hypothetical protein